MAIRGTGSAVNGWRRPLQLSSANYPITMSCWINLPPSPNSSGLWGLASANALAHLIYWQPAAGLIWDQMDDAAVAYSGVGSAFTFDSKWHHVACQIRSDGAPPSGQQSFQFWIDGVPLGFYTDLDPGFGTRTFTDIQIGVAPTDGSEPVFDTATALAEIAVFATGALNPDMSQTIRALAQGGNPLRVPGAESLRAYHPLRRDLRDLVGQRIGFRQIGTPGDPVWVNHPNIDAPLLLRRVAITHVAAALVGTSSSVDAGSGTLTTSIPLAGTGSSTDSSTGSLLASVLQTAPTLNRNSGLGTLTAATHLVGTGNQTNVGAALMSGTQIPMAGSGSSTNAAVASLTIPTVLAASQQMQNALIDAIIRGQPIAWPADWYVALVTQLGDTVTSGVEVTGGNYLRSHIAASLANFSGTQGPGTTAASVGSSGLSSNNIAISYSAPTTDWGAIVGYEFWDAPGAGNRWLSGKLGAAVTIHSGDGARSFPIASLSVSIG